MEAGLAWVAVRRYGRLSCEMEFVCFRPGEHSGAELSPLALVAATGIAAGPNSRTPGSTTDRFITVLHRRRFGDVTEWEQTWLGARAGMDGMHMDAPTRTLVRPFLTFLFLPRTAVTWASRNPPFFYVTRCASPRLPSSCNSHHLLLSATSQPSPPFGTIFYHQQQWVNNNAAGGG